jgi:2-C-methyl-D-erythritol 4-phosphate cytidylyltransferase
MINKYAVIVAGGKGLRMGSEMPKQFLLLSGKPILFYSIITFLKTFPNIHIILVLPVEFINFAKTMFEVFPGGENMTFVTGGVTRFDSVKNGLNAIKEPGIVFVHDGARPLISKDLISRCCEQAISLGSAIPAIPIAESIRHIDDENSKPVDRDKLRIIQTPQTFKTDIILDAFKCDYKPDFTDEATVVEANGLKVHLIQGEKRNIKITTKEDLIIAEAYLKQIEIFSPNSNT